MTLRLGVSSPKVLKFFGDSSTTRVKVRLFRNDRKSETAGESPFVLIGAVTCHSSAPRRFNSTVFSSLIKEIALTFSVE